MDEKEYKKKYYLKNREKALAYQKKHYEENKEKNRETHKSQCQEYYKNNLERERKKARRYFINNSKNLSDYYVKKTICKKSNLINADIPPELVALKREYLKLIRIKKEKDYEREGKNKIS
jgi:hypothetical protein